MRSLFTVSMRLNVRDRNVTLTQATLSYGCKGRYFRAMITALNATESLEGLDMNALLVKAPSLPLGTTLATAVETMTSGDFRCLAVTDGERVLGICSRRRFTELFSKQFGQSIFSRHFAESQMENEFMSVRIDQPMIDILQRVFARSESVFWQDVVVLDSEGRYLGLFNVPALAKLQTQLVSEKVSHLEERSDRLLKANDRLRVLADRLQDTNSKLAIARDESLQAARSKSEFLAVMSHEIRTPLNGILGMISLLVDSDLNEEQLELSQAANESAEALLLILNDILDFSRLDSGKIDLELVPFKIRELTESVLTLMAENAQESDLEVICDIGLDVPLMFSSDAGRIRQVLTNMIGNAIKFTPSGEVGVAVSKRSPVGQRLELRFEVWDTGIGISKEAQMRLFQPFSQADSSTTRNYGGTGLGLAICRRLINAMGGEVGVESEEGKGSRFWFTVPCGSSESEFSEPYQPIMATGSLKACVAMRNERVSEVVRRELERRGVQTMVLGDASEIDGQKNRCAGEGCLLILDEVIQRSGIGDGWNSNRLALVHSSHGYAQSGADDGCIHLCKPIRPSQIDRLLLKANKADVGEKPAAPKPVSHEARPTRDDCRILLVEDNAVNRKLAVRLLERLGYECDQAVDGLDALEVCETNRYDLILLDCSMPRMDGYQFATRLRENERSEKISQAVKIVALTAHALQGDRERCLEAGMDDYLAKPLKVGALKEILEGTFGRPPAPA